MLYKLARSTAGRYEALEPLPFEGMPKEKELEDLIAQNLLNVLFEDNNHFPIFQERAWQEEADIYALNRSGDLVIFELKRGAAGEGAVHQALRYCEQASRRKYEQLEAWFRRYRKDPTLSLREEHRVAFELDRPLDASQFNTRQQLVLVGTAGDAELIRNVDYWKSRGLDIEFLPYRVYRIGHDAYFEFFALPYDRHSNPAEIKGVIFDTNYSYDAEGIWYMCENARVAAFGEIRGIVHSLRPKDMVFLYHRGVGIVAVGEVRGPVEEDDAKDASYRKLRWLTKVPKRDDPWKALSAAQTREVMGFGFWWAKTMKPPYLNAEESGKLLDAVKAKLA